MSMKQDVELLLRDLCSRLPYGVKALCTEVSTKKVYEIEGVCVYHKDVPIVHLRNQGLINMPIMYVKPYLFPLSSMTEEQKKEYNRWKHEVPVCHYEYGDVVEEVELFDSPESFEYLIENHFDYRGLIEKGLALDATGLNIY